MCRVRNIEIVINGMSLLNPSHQGSWNSVEEEIESSQESVEMGDTKNSRPSRHNRTNNAHLSSQRL